MRRACVIENPPRCFRYLASGIRRFFSFECYLQSLYKNLRPMFFFPSKKSSNPFGIKCPWPLFGTKLRLPQRRRTRGLNKDPGPLSSPQKRFQRGGHSLKFISKCSIVNARGRIPIKKLTPDSPKQFQCLSHLSVAKVLSCDGGFVLFGASMMCHCRLPLFFSTQPASVFAGITPSERLS